MIPGGNYIPSFNNTSTILVFHQLYKEWWQSKLWTTNLRVPKSRRTNLGGYGKSQNHSDKVVAHNGLIVTDLILRLPSNVHSPSLSFTAMMRTFPGSFSVPGLKTAKTEARMDSQNAIHNRTKFHTERRTAQILPTTKRIYQKNSHRCAWMSKRILPRSQRLVTITQDRASQRYAAQMMTNSRKRTIRSACFSLQNPSQFDAIACRGDLLPVRGLL